MTRSSGLAPALAVAAATLLGGCADFTLRRPGPESVPVIRGPAITDNGALLGSAFACYREALLEGRRGAAPAQADALSIGVGEVRDYTGKSSINEGAVLTQGGTLMVISALGRLAPALSVHERFDPRVGELELIYADRRQLGDGRVYGVPGAPGQMQQVPWLPYMGGSIMQSRYFIVGGITELNWNLQSGGAEARVQNVGPGGRTFTANIAIDLRIVDTRSLVVLRTVSLQKQVTGHEVELNVFRFFGNRLFDVSAGTRSQEPMQLAVRTTLELGVLELISSVSGVSYEPCIADAVRDGVVSATYNASLRPPAPMPRAPMVPQPLSPMPVAPPPASGAAPRAAAPVPPRASAPAPSQPPVLQGQSGQRPDAQMRPAIPSYLQGPQLLPPPGSLSLTPQGPAAAPMQMPMPAAPAAPAAPPAGQTWPDPQRQSQPAPAEPAATPLGSREDPAPAAEPPPRPVRVLGSRQEGRERFAALSPLAVTRLGNPSRMARKDDARPGWLDARLIPSRQPD